MTIDFDGSKLPNVSEPERNGSERYIELYGKRVLLSEPLRFRDKTVRQARFNKYKLNNEPEYFVDVTDSQDIKVYKVYRSARVSPYSKDSLFCEFLRTNKYKMIM